MKLNIGCGVKKVKGYHGVDISDKVGADFVHDLTEYPWPFEDNSIDEILCEHFVEHLDGMERMPFFNECWRIMKPGATMLCVTPGAFTSRYMQDPTHKFPMVVWEFYNYLNKQVRENSGLGHYPLTCDFTFEGHHKLYELPVSDQNFIEKHFVNSVHELKVTLTKLP